MKLEKALLQIENLAGELISDEDETIRILGASLMSLPMAAERGAAELTNLIHGIFQLSREMMERSEEAEKVIKNLLEQNEN
jgi:hypothetical protein